MPRRCEYGARHEETYEARSLAQLSPKNSRIRSLFDHLVGAGEQHRRHLQAERLSGLEVDDELELG